MNPIDRLLGRSNEETQTTQEAETVEDKEDEDEEEELEPAYNLSRDNKVRFDEVITIDTEEKSEFATITIETIAESITFDVRISGYTSRFGDLDVEYISGGGYAVNLYHKRQDEEGHFVRRLYYYADENGVGSEQHRDNSSEPMNFVWERESDFGSVVEETFQSTYLTVYDWRESMITTGKPTPDEGEVVVRYKDSLRSGGGRKEVDNVFNAVDANGVIGDTYSVQFVSVDVHTGSYVLHSETDEGESHLIYVPLNKQASLDNCSLKEVEDLDSPFDVNNVIWTRDPEETWAIEGFTYGEEDDEDYI